ncbi:cytolytic toxin-alpha-like isoform X2 [Salminus brasiliensis]|uniref:cytolytic toxin-alpha-like isoform X2 n=1 Tax=Salminus brasiliensis TaxID=930266 RepID=UPI003B835403
MKSDRSMDPPVVFHVEREDQAPRKKLERTSMATCMSTKSDQSMDPPATFRDESTSNNRCPVCTDEMKGPVSTHCGYSYCKTCSQNYGNTPTYEGSSSCPQCRRNSGNCALAEVVQKRDEGDRYAFICAELDFHDADFSPDFVEVAAVGRPLKLGMLYDCRSDSLSSDVFLWDVDTVSSMKLSLPRPHTDVRILEGDSLQERLRALGLTTALRASVVSGLVEVAGAAAFLKHPTQSQLQDRVTLHYRTSTRLDMLSHRLLRNGAPLSVTNQSSATHVVVAVLYGGQAFFVFDKDSESSDGVQELKASVSEMISCSGAADLLSDLSSDREEAGCASDKCSVYTDAEDFRGLVDFQTAVKLYGHHQKLLGPHGGRAVPLTAWLYPLKNLEQTPASVLQEISDDLLHRAERVLDHLDFVRRDLGLCQDMMSGFSNLGGITWFVALKATLCQFALLLQQYQAAFQRRLASCIRTTREKGEEGQERLRDLLQRNSQAPFSPQNMYQWLQNKDAEVRALNECRAANITIAKSHDDLKRLVEDSQAGRVLCFTLTSLEGGDPFLAALKQHIRLVIMENRREVQPPFRLSDTSQKILSDLRSFLFTREAEEPAEETKFIAASVPDGRFPGSSIHLYHSGNGVSQNLIVDVRPAAAEIVAVTRTRVTLKLQSVEMTFADRYRVEYKAVSCRGATVLNTGWKTIEIWRTGSTSVVLGIKPETQYQLRYAVMDSNSMSDYSRITEFQTPPRSRPGRPTVLKQNTDSLTVTWQSAEADGDSPVLRYMVEYMEAGLEGWQSVLTEGPECEYTITLPYSTCYRVRVSAVYGEEDTSKPSEETAVALDVTTEDLPLVQSRTPWLKGELSSVLRRLASLLKLWKVQCMKLLESTMEVQFLSVLLHLNIRVSDETLLQLVFLVYEAQEGEFTHSFLQKVGGDLSSCSLQWKVIQYFLQYHTVTVDFRKSSIKQQNIRELLTVLDRVQLRRILFS